MPASNLRLGMRIPSCNRATLACFFFLLFRPFLPAFFGVYCDPAQHLSLSCSLSISRSIASPHTHTHGTEEWGEYFSRKSTRSSIGILGFLSRGESHIPWVPSLLAAVWRARTHARTYARTYARKQEGTKPTNQPTNQPVNQPASQASQPASQAYSRVFL